MLKNYFERARAKGASKMTKDRVLQYTRATTDLSADRKEVVEIIRNTDPDKLAIELAKAIARGNKAVSATDLLDITGPQQRRDVIKATKLPISTLVSRATDARSVTDGRRVPYECVRLANIFEGRGLSDENLAILQQLNFFREERLSKEDPEY